MNNTTDILNQWLQELNSSSAAPLSLDQDNRCFMATSSNIELMICGEPLSENFTVLLHICDLAEPVDTALFKALLALNLKPANTYGGALGYDRDNQSLILSYSHEYQGITAREFGNMLENLSHAALSLRKHINSLLEESGTPAQARQHPLHMVRI
ncbi:CesT family type III secretion system chaperone [Thalassomonas actiniarum]|uniref:Type III secretion system chaperone n=1 Tax=Thalassomonas actiniarum TaxID=485447 RepID=A0AAE9YTD2_9GAMM|nr:CesT family type III secretion system chaperone [Thalassomonas actiniarum]WDD99963.1 type III secretion system chaperone [Thalassomonas actiniarum]